MKPIPYDSRNPKHNTNYAKYLTPYHSKDNPLCSCAWMNLHKDEYPDNFGNPFYIIKIHYIHPNAVFVHKLNGQYMIEELKEGDILKFRYRDMHGLLPRNLAVELCKRNTAVFGKYRRWVKKIDNNAFNMKCKWEFIKDEIQTIYRTCTR